MKKIKPNVMPFTVKKQTVSGTKMPVLMPKNLPTTVKGNDPVVTMKGMRKHMGW